MFRESNAERPLFTFRTSSGRPIATVVCHWCGWKAKGSDPRKVFPLADSHVCKAAK
jgi:hypothetical protein